MVVSTDEIADLGVIFQGCKPRPGSMFVRHPFTPNAFVNAATSEQQIIQERLQKFGKIAQELGAFQYTFKVKSLECSSRDISIKTKLSVSSFKAKGRFKKQCKEQIDDERSGREEYSAIKVSDAISRAMEYASKYGLDNDVDVKTLIDKANSDNHLKLIETTIDATRGLEQSMDAAFSLTSMSGPLNIDVSVIENTTYKKRLIVKMSLSFDKDIKLFKSA
jgi:hypothetical protein